MNYIRQSMVKEIAKRSGKRVSKDFLLLLNRAVGEMLERSIKGEPKMTLKVIL